MATTAPTLDSPGDAELISAVRGGDVDAYGQLFERHVQAARRLARQLVPAGDVEDLVSEAFIKVLKVLQRGAGPDVAFRAYLLTAVRRLHVDKMRAGARLHTTDDMEQFDPGVPFRDTAVEGFESAAAARAFASLPERWQMVLWHTEVEGQKPADVAPLLGMSPNSVSALAYRAREGLRQAFLSQHAADTEDDTCRWTHQHLGAYVRHGLSRRDSGKVEQHLQECRRCTAIYLELTQVNDNLAGILAPLLLGGVAAAYVSASTGAATSAAGGLLALLDRVKDGVLANTGATAAGGVAAVTVVAGATFVAVQPDDTGPVADLPAASSPASPTTPPGAQEPPPGTGGDGGTPPGRDRPDRPATTARGGSSDASPTPASTPGPPAPSPAPSPAPPPEPTPQPGPGTPPPDRPPGDEPHDPPDDEPDEPDEPEGPPPRDLRLSGHAEPGLAGGTMTVIPAGLSRGTTATLTVRSDRPTLALRLLDLRCDLLALGTATCRVSAADPSPFSFRVVGREGTLVTFTLASDDGPDADPGDNTVTLAVP